MEKINLVSVRGTCNHRVASFGCPVHLINSTKKKRLLSAGFECNVRKGGACCRNGMHFHIPPINKTSLLHHQSTKQVCFDNQRMLAELLL
jgi:hypothetical protein